MLFMVAERALGMVALPREQHDHSMTVHGNAQSLRKCWLRNEAFNKEELQIMLQVTVTVCSMTLLARRLPALRQTSPRL